MTAAKGMQQTAIRKFCEDFGFIILTLSVIMSMVGVITTPILMSENIEEKQSLVLALAGFLCPIVMFIFLVIAYRIIGSEVVNKGIMSFFYTAAVSLHIASLVHQSRRKKHEALILIYTGLILEVLFLIISILNLFV